MALAAQGPWLASRASARRHSLRILPTCSLSSSHIRGSSTSLSHTMSLSEGVSISFDHGFDQPTADRTHRSTEARLRVRVR